ncbi:MAG: hypothetical protein CTY33_06410 [Methylotenera sp.]|nr:MAG: hypothetical protein CTY33_06410 [Methylotenera sp.]
MDKAHYIYLNRQAILMAMISAAFPAGAYAAAGKVEFASGGAALQGVDGSSKVLTKGMEVNQGDTILTGDGRAQVRFTDGGYFSFQPNTEFKVEEYNFNGKQDGSEKGFFKLLRGGLRAVTGFVGRENRPAYRLGTPVATIGIRGTYYLAEFQQKLKAHVGQGSIYIFNEQGDIILFSGQSADVEPGKAPAYSDEEMTLGAKGPEGGQPEKGEQEQQAENDNNDVFRVSEQYSDTGMACLAADCGISSVITNLNAINAEGEYKLDTTVASVGKGGGWTSKLNDSSYFTASFSGYTISGSIGVDSSRPNPTSAGFEISRSNVFSISGGLASNGSLAMSGTNSSMTGVCYNACTLNVIGFFSGNQAEKASVGYIIKETNPGDFLDNGFFSTTAGQIEGTAGFIANPPPAPPGPPS